VDCLLAQAASCEPCGREWKYGSLSLTDSAVTVPSMITCRWIGYHGNSRQALGCSASWRPLVEVRLV
jgi:hypothetical protein